MGDFSHQEDDGRYGEVALEDVLWVAEFLLAVAGGQEEDGVGHDSDGS